MSMLPTHEVLMLIGSMQPVSTKALKESGDWQPRQPSNAIYQLKQNGLVETIEGEHWLTSKGQAELKELDKNPAKKLTELAAEAVQHPVIGEAEKKMISAPPGGFRPPAPPKDDLPVEKADSFAADYYLLDRLIETFNSCAGDLSRIRDRLRSLDKAGH